MEVGNGEFVGEYVLTVCFFCFLFFFFIYFYSLAFFFFFQKNFIALMEVLEYG